MKRTIRLTESELHGLIRECIEEIMYESRGQLTEAFQSQLLTKLVQKHGGIDMKKTPGSTRIDFARLTDNDLGSFNKVGDHGRYIQFKDGTICGINGLFDSNSPKYYYADITAPDRYDSPRRQAHRDYLDHMKNTRPYDRKQALSDIRTVNRFKKADPDIARMRGLEDDYYDALTRMDTRRAGAFMNRGEKFGNEIDPQYDDRFENGGKKPGPMKNYGSSWNGDTVNWDDAKNGLYR